MNETMNQAGVEDQACLCAPSQNRFKPTSVLFVLCWLVYFCAYLGRLNYSAGMAEFIHLGILEKPQAGMIGTILFVTYGAGQVGSGFLGDRISPKSMVFMGLAASAAVNLCMGVFLVPGVLMGASVVNGLAQSMLWPPILRIISRWMEEERQSGRCVSMSAASVLGTVCIYAITAAVIRFLPTAFIFLIPALFLGGMAVSWIVMVSRIEPMLDKREESTQSVPEIKRQRKWKLFIAAGLIPIGLTVICHGILKESVVAWIPTYLFETFHTDTSAAVLSTVIIPLIGLAGAYGATKLLHICGNSESGAAAIFFTVALVCFILLRALGDHSLWMTLLLFGIITAAMHGVNTLYVSLFPLRYGHLGITSSLTGLLNACTYLGTSISNYGIGAVAQFSTWNTVAILWSVFALLGVVLTLYCKNGEGKERAY